MIDDDLSGMSREEPEVRRLREPVCMREYRAMAEFPVAWRWTSAEHAVLGDDDLARIRPLSLRSAEDAGKAALARRPDASGIRIFAPAEQAELVANALATLPIARDEVVLVSWDSRTAAETTWTVFRRHWDSFCYPGSDDVTIWAPSSAWTLAYEHSGFFVFHRG